MPEHPIPRMFKQLAESIVNPVERQKSVQHAIDIMEGRDPNVRPPMMDSGGMAGLTRRQAVESVLGMFEGRPLAKGGTPEHVKDTFAKAVAILQKGAPTKALRDLESITKAGPSDAYSSKYRSAPFEVSTGTGGTHFSNLPEYKIPPRITMEPVVEASPVFKERAGLSNTLDEVLPHELGHEVTSRLVQRLSKRYGQGGQPSQFEQELYNVDPKMFEAWADTIGEVMRKKAGVNEMIYRPEEYFGPLGRFSTQMRENLMTNRPKNPYLDLRTWLESFIQKQGYTKGGR